MTRIAAFLRMIAVSRLAMVGAALTTSGVLAEILLVVGELFFFESHPYIGIVTYVLIPGVIVLGLALIPFGLFLRVRRARTRFSLTAIDELSRARGVNLGYASQVILTLTMLNLVIFSLVGYRGFHYTESVEFCGELCHEVMHPEFTTYSRSPHSRIECVQCHIGPGAGWFVKSKLSGARQLVAVVADTYSRPIQTPVHNLRPAREVCEVCHRPEVFHGNLVKVIEHFENDEANSRTWTVLNMRVGGGDQPGRVAHGIHWHVSETHQVRYWARDEKREDIAWVEVRNADGTTRTFTNRDDPVAPPADAEIRTMDCVDCHNRPTHIYLPPDAALDEWMATGRLDPSIPWIRQTAFDLLIPPYDTQDEAMAALATLPDVYRRLHPDAWAEHEEAVRAAVPVIQEIHRSYVFPSMNIQWNTYNSLIGHPTPYTQACFRCHNGLLQDEAGTAITLDCNRCHYILADREKDPRILDRLERR